MKIIEQSYSFESIPAGGTLELIEKIGRTCYKSEDRITEDSAKAFVQKIMTSGHHSVIEHVNVSVRMITDRGVTHEIVRHRLASYSQESTRYCNYSKDKHGNEITVILPVWYRDISENNEPIDYYFWKRGCEEAGISYSNLLKAGQSPQQARSVLPNSLKTEIVMTANLREWRHFFKLRTAPAAHPQMVDLAKQVLAGFQERIPILFDEFNSERP